MIMIGKHKYSLSPEDWAFAALTIWLDIIQLFFYILLMVGGRD